MSLEYIAPLPEIAPTLTRDDTAALYELMNAGLLDRDVVAFGPGLTLNDLDITLTMRGAIADAHPENEAWGGGLLSVRWNGGDAGFDTTVLDRRFGYDADADENLLDNASDGNERDKIWSFATLETTSIVRLRSASSNSRNLGLATGSFQSLCQNAQVRADCAWSRTPDRRTPA